MNRQSLSFAIPFLLAAGAVAPFVYRGEPQYALAAGVAGLLLHWLLSRGGDRDGEVADASYFFGFLLTLVFLAVGLYRIGAPSEADGTRDILSFLVDLSAGLMLTIAGLLIRQLRTLAGDARASRDDAALVTVQRELAENLKAVTELWRARPEHQVLEVLQESRSNARDAAEKLDRSIAAAGNRMLESVQRLDEATTTVTQSMTRAASGMSSSLSEITQRLEVEIQCAVDALQKAASEVRTVNEQQLELWRSSLEQARGALDLAHRHLQDEFRRSIAGFSASGQAFAQLAQQTTAYVQALPNPAERLAGLWDGVRQLETDLTEAIAGSVLELGALRERAQQLSNALEQLGGSADRAAGLISSGGERLAGSLNRELRQMNEIIEDYVSLLEQTERSLRVRA